MIEAHFTKVKATGVRRGLRNLDPLRSSEIPEVTPTMNQPKTTSSNPLRMSQPTRTPPPTAPRLPGTIRRSVTPLMMLGGLVLLLVVAYWDMFSLTSAAWSEGLYSHGWIVPLFALWLDVAALGAVRSGAHAGALDGTGTAGRWPVLRFVAAWYGSPPVDRLSFLPAIFGVFMLVGGLNIIRWAWPGLGFLVFMFPLPNVFENVILLRLQTLASICSTFVLQTLGVAAFRSGQLHQHSRHGLDSSPTRAAACEWSRFLCALAVAMVFLIERPWWDKFVILLSAIPIALVVNIIRITVTGSDVHVVAEEARSCNTCRTTGPAGS